MHGGDANLLQALSTLNLAQLPWLRHLRTTVVSTLEILSGIYAELNCSKKISSVRSCWQLLETIEKNYARVWSL